MIILALALSFILPTSAFAATSGFSGEWTTTFGNMSLQSASGTVSGRYLMGGMDCTIEGREESGVLTFRYQEKTIGGKGRFRLAPDGQSFEGEWLQDGQSEWSGWRGRRRAMGEAGAIDLAGLWETSFGRLRLEQTGRDVSGVYVFGDGSLQGSLDGATLRFRYKDTAAGEGEFNFAPDGRNFRGRWRADGSERWQDWIGSRVEPLPGRRWLVVLEARWEAGLEDREYSYGQMLKSFFSPNPQVEVRQRFYTDRRSLMKWLRETSFLAEPAIVYLSAHGSEKGPHTDDGPADAEFLASGLRGNAAVRLLHFGACEVMNGPVPREIHRRLSGDSRFPISGFAQTVDWGTSAVADFMYLNLILGKGLSPERAAAELKRLMPFTARTSTGAGYDGLSFRFMAPPAIKHGKLR